MFAGGYGQMQFGAGFGMSMGMGMGDPFGCMGGMAPMGGMGSFMQMQFMNQVQIAQQMQLMFQIMQQMAAPAQAPAAGGTPAAQGLAPTSASDAMMAYFNMFPPSTGVPWGGAPGAGTPAAPLTQPAAPATGGISAKTRNFIDISKAQQGKPYVFGAAGPSKFDCSGLVCWSLKQAGVNVPRLAARGYQAKYANHKVDRKDLKPGDLLFFWSPNDRGIPKGQATHIEIYLGDGKSMGTDNPKEGARIEPVNWGTFIGGARVPELQA